MPGIKTCAFLVSGLEIFGFVYSGSCLDRNSKNPLSWPGLKFRVNPCSVPPILRKHRICFPFLTRFAIICIKLFNLEK
jgi:hypothetical protein